MKINLSFLLCTFGILNLMSCQNQKEIIRTEVLTPAPAPVGSAPMTQGTIDSGGGSGFDNKPLESFKINVEEEARFKAGINPIIENLRQSFPELAADIIHIARERGWYFLPANGQLNKLPSELIGAAVPNDLIEQLALQNLGEVWMDATLFEKMRNDEDRVMILLHELVMGVRLLEFQKSLDICLRDVVFKYINEKEISGEFKNDRKKCYQDNWGDTNIIEINRKKIELSKEDYISIRKVVRFIYESKGIVDKENFSAELKALHIRQY